MHGHTEESENLKDPYKDIMMDDQPTLSSSGIKRKTKEHSKEVRDAIVQMHAQGKGYKKIAKYLDLPVVTVGSIIRKWKVHHTTETLPRRGRHSKFSAQRSNFVRKETEVKNENVIKTEVEEVVEETRDEEPCEEEAMAAEISTDSEDISGAPENVRLEDEDGEIIGIEQDEVPLVFGTDSEDISEATENVRLKDEEGEIIGIEQDEDEDEVLHVPSTGVKRKTKEYSKEVRDLIVEMHKCGKGYKKISKCLDIPRVTVSSIIRKWKVHQTTDSLPRTGRPSKLSAETRSNIVRKATERPTITLMELQSSLAETGVKVHRSTISRVLHNTGLFARMAQK
ncbi:uncharacterized protein [Hyperolius riggenbachi]|uniref:uncharacterized protein isoform X2 n=1 Tax=Hyperolius riggenbachi TaxID=752182 RepID=UPI0035A2C567